MSNVPCIGMGYFPKFSHIIPTTSSEHAWSCIVSCFKFELLKTQLSIALHILLKFLFSHNLHTYIIFVSTCMPALTQDYELLQGLISGMEIFNIFVHASNHCLLRLFAVVKSSRLHLRGDRAIISPFTDSCFFQILSY